MQIVDEQQGAAVGKPVAVRVIRLADEVRPETAGEIAGTQPNLDAIQARGFFRVDEKARRLGEPLAMTLSSPPALVLSGHENLNQLRNQHLPGKSEVIGCAEVDGDVAFLVVAAATVCSSWTDLNHEGDSGGRQAVEPGGDGVIVPLAGRHQSVRERARFGGVERLIELE